MYRLHSTDPNPTTALLVDAQQGRGTLERQNQG